MKHLFLWILLWSLVVATDADSQWSQLPGPFGGRVAAFYQEVSKIYVTASTGLYVSTDDGYHWSSQEVSLPPDIFSWRILFKKNNVLLIETRAVGNLSDLYRSTNEGKSFEKIMDSALFSLAQVGEELWLARWYQYPSSDKRNLLRSSDHGQTWTVQVTPSLMGMVEDIASDGKNIFCIARKEIERVVWRSFDNGATWDSLRGAPQASDFLDYYQATALIPVIHGSDTNLWIGYIPPSFQGDLLPTLYHVNNRESVLQGTPSIIDKSVHQLYSSDHSLFVVMSGSILKYDFATTTWLDITYNVTDFGIGTFLPIRSSQKGDMLMGYFDGIVRLDAQLQSYSRSDSGLTLAEVSSLVSRNDTLYAVTSRIRNSLWFSHDRGQSWEHIDYRAGQSFQISDMIPVSKGLLVGLDSTIDLFTNFIHTRVASVPNYISQLHKVGDTIYCLSQLHWTVSTDEGATWTYRGKMSLGSLSSNGSTVGEEHRIVQCGGPTIITSTDGALTWDTIFTAPYNVGAQKAALYDNALFIGGRIRENGITHTGILRTDDLGKSWEMISPQLPWDLAFAALYPLGNQLICGTSKGLFVCGLHGEGWSAVAAPTGGIKTITQDSVNLYVGTENAGIWRASIADLKKLAKAPPNSETAAEDLQIYPNPATGSITIDINDTYSYIEILDLLGRVVLRSEQFEQYDVSDLAKGVYYLKAFSKNNILVATGKFVKE